MNFLKIYSCLVLFLISFKTFSQNTTSSDLVSKRIAEITPPEKDLPEQLLALYDERNRVDKEIEKYQEQLSDLGPIDDNVKTFDQLKEKATNLISDIMKLNCPTSDGSYLENLENRLAEVRRKISDIIFDYDIEDENPWASTIVRARNETLNSNQLCEKLKNVLGNQQKNTVLISFIDKIRQTADEYAKKDQATKAQLQSLITLLQQRRQKIQEKLADLMSKQGVSNDLWLLIIVIGILSIGTIFVIRLFPESLQDEWVKSGQVIQFITVMILLSVIMSLGLATILKENTLGTLLGGIAGYVLSQGVGRAVANQMRQQGQLGSNLPIGAPITATKLSITSVLPNQGGINAVTMVKITGSGFTNGITVKAGDTITSSTVLDSTTIVATFPPHATGLVDIILTATDGNSFTLKDGFRYL